MTAMDYKCFIRSKNQYKILWPVTSLQLLKYSYDTSLLICQIFHVALQFAKILTELLNLASYCKHFGNLLLRVSYLFAASSKSPGKKVDILGLKTERTVMKRMLEPAVHEPVSLT